MFVLIVLFNEIVRLRRSLALILIHHNIHKLSMDDSHTGKVDNQRDSNSQREGDPGDGVSCLDLLWDRVFKYDVLF